MVTPTFSLPHPSGNLWRAECLDSIHAQKRQEPEGAPYLSPSASAENEGSSTLYQEV